MSRFISVTGRIMQITPMSASPRDHSGCTLMISILSSDFAQVNLMVSPATYIYRQTPFQQGDAITAFYDSMAPVPLIYPPQYRPLAIVPAMMGQQVVMDYFDRNLLSSDGTLQLNITGSTSVILTNGLNYQSSPAEHFLLVIYGASTRSIPAITTPDQVVVFCFSP